MAGNVKEITDNDFSNEVLNSEVPVLVDFWAPWCGPCKSIAPTLEELAIQFGAKLKIVKINVDDNPLSPSNYDVRGIPNLVFFKKGQVADRVVGAVPKDALIDVINRVIA